MKDYCNICIHQSVCMFKSHYEDAEQMYQQIREKCSEYPFFGVYIECTEFCSTRQLELWTDNQNGTRINAEVLDKIRAEIDQYLFQNEFGSAYRKEVSQIIDKYKAESEV